MTFVTLVSRPSQQRLVVIRNAMIDKQNVDNFELKSLNKQIKLTTNRQCLLFILLKVVERDTKNIETRDSTI